MSNVSPNNRLFPVFSQQQGFGGQFNQGVENPFSFPAQREQSQQSADPVQQMFDRFLMMIMVLMQQFMQLLQLRGPQGHQQGQGNSGQDDTSQGQNRPPGQRRGQEEIFFGGFFFGGRRGRAPLPAGQAGRITDPLALDLDGGGIETTEANKSFDIDGDGNSEQTSWFGDDEGVLTFDANGDGTSGSDGRELLGNHSDVNGDGKGDGYKNGFDALRALAQDRLGDEALKDGKLDAEELKQLEEKAGLKIRQGDKELSFKEAGVQSINLDYNKRSEGDEGFRDAHRNEHREHGTFTTENGDQIIEDVWLRHT